MTGSEYRTERENEELEIVAPLERYGLMNDPDFRHLRISSTDPAGAVWVGAGSGASAAFVSAPTRVSMLPVNVLMPLGGSAESPLLDAHMWGEGRFLHFAEQLRSLPAWQVCRISGLFGELTEKLQTALQARRLPFRRIPYYSRIISGFQSYDEYFKSRSKNFRNGARSAWRKAEQAGFHLTEEVGLENWKALYVQRHPTMPGLDYSITPEFHRFLAGLLGELVPQGRIMEVGLWQGDKPAGAGLGLCCGEVLYFYQTAHDPAMAAFRPGLIVFCRMIERALAGGFRHIVFQSDAEYLMHYTQQVLELTELEVFASGLVPRGLYAYRQLKDARPLH